MCGDTSSATNEEGRICGLLVLDEPLMMTVHGEEWKRNARGLGSHYLIFSLFPLSTPFLLHCSDLSLPIGEGGEGEREREERRGRKRKVKLDQLRPL